MKKTTKLNPVQSTEVTMAGKVEGPKASTNHVEDLLVRSKAIAAAATIYSAPQFATATNPPNIISLANLFTRYIKGEVTVTYPENLNGAPELINTI
jgi:hypothetical protein